MSHEEVLHAPERAIQRLAARQFRCVTAAQVMRRGVSRGTLRGLVARGWLVREHRGVYRVGPEPLGRMGRWAAALLAVGRGAALSYRSAAECREWVSYDQRLPVHVTAPGRRRHHAGVVVHEAALGPGERQRHGRFWVTSPSRTLSDLAASEPASLVAEAVHEAEVQRQLRPEVLAAAHARPGAPVLRALGGDRLPVEGDVRLQLEGDFARFRHERRYPRAATNAWVRLERPTERVRLDVLWADHDLAVELDGRAVHATQRSFDEDRRRDRRVLVQHGIHVVRVTWRHLHGEPDDLDVDLRQILAARGGSPGAR